VGLGWVDYVPVRLRTKSRCRGIAPVGMIGRDRVPLAEVKDDFSRYLKEAAAREIVITRHGKPAGVLIGFESEDDWLEYRLENDPRFLRRIARARASLRSGRGVALEDIE
jgi:prevent-host-death family protein